MAKVVFKTCLRLFFVATISFGLVSQTFFTPAFAQTAEGQEVKSSGPRKQLATIIFAGLGGAVLGLSTLSFYGRPQDYLANIAMGFAIGIISGTIYVTYKAATVPQTLYGATLSPPDPTGNNTGFLTSSRYAFDQWQELKTTGAAHQLQLTWNF